MIQSEDSPIVRIGNSDFDLSRGPDIGLLHRAFVGYESKRMKRWEDIDRPLKSQIVQAAKVALRIALAKEDPSRIIMATNFLASLERDNQADEHLEFRSDKGMKDGTTVNILNQNGTDDPRAVLAEMLRDPAKAVELGRLADKLGPPDKTQHV